MINFQLIVSSLPTLLRGALVTVQIASLSSSIGLILGTLLAIGSKSPWWILQKTINGYVHIIRGIPMLIQIMIFAYVLPQLGLQLSFFWAAVLAIGLNSSAYICNIVRAGISSVGRGQIEAARVLGLRNLQIMRFIVLPQALQTTLPALGNEFVTLIKDSSLAQVIGVVELAKSGNAIRALTLDSISVFTAVCLIYLAMTVPLSLLIGNLERRINQHAQP